MKRSRLLVLFFLCLTVGVLWLLWVNPKPVDMTSYAPANSLLYLEANNPLGVLEALQGTEAWQLLHEHPITLQAPSRGRWLQKLIRVTGIGPIDSVVMARSQLAVVVTDLAANQHDETLNVKPEAALILETHTAERRIRAPVERALQNLVTNAYGSSQPQRSTVDGVQSIAWRNQDGSRQVIATFFGSLVIVGNSQRAVDTCLNVARRRAPSLKGDPDLHRTRGEHSSGDALAFGYVPASESARLISFALPIMLGRPSGDVEFQKLIDRAATKLLGRLAWSCRPFKSGIEDRYQISLQQSVITQLKPNFGSIKSSHQIPQTRGFYSISRYKFEDPLRAWQSMKTTISGNVEALAAVIFNSVLKAGLLGYGIDEPEVFLGAVKSDITTMRLDRQGDRQLLVASVSDVSKLTELLELQMGFKKRKSATAGTDVFESSDGNTGAALSMSLIVIGHPTDVQQYFLSIDQRGTNDGQETRQIAYFATPNNSSHVSTYTNDSERVSAFLAAMLKFSGVKVTNTSQVEVDIAALPYAVTETTLSDQGVERVTRSPMGQFSTLIPLFASEPPSPVPNTP